MPQKFFYISEISLNEAIQLPFIKIYTVLWHWRHKMQLFIKEQKCSIVIEPGMTTTNNSDVISKMIFFLLLSGSEAICHCCYNRIKPTVTNQFSECFNLWDIKWMAIYSERSECCCKEVLCFNETSLKEIELKTRSECLRTKQYKSWLFPFFFFPYLLIMNDK